MFLVVTKTGSDISYLDLNSTFTMTKLLTLNLSVVRVCQACLLGFLVAYSVMSYGMRRRRPGDEMDELKWSAFFRFLLVFAFSEFLVGFLKRARRWLSGSKGGGGDEQGSGRQQSVESEAPRTSSVDSGRSSEKRSTLNRDARISIWEGGSKGIHRPSVTSSLSGSGSRIGSGSLGGRRLDSFDEELEGVGEEGGMGLNPGYI